MKQIKIVLLVAILLFIGCKKNGLVHPKPIPEYYTLIVDNNTWLDSDIYVEGQFVGRVNCYSTRNMGNFLQNENNNIKAMYGDSVMIEQYINTVGMDNYEFTLECPTFELYVENQQIHYGNYSWFIDYDLYVNGNYVGKWNDILGLFEQREYTQLCAKVNRYPNLECIIDSREKENYTWVLEIPMFTLYIECNFDGEGNLLVDDKWDIGVYQSYRTTYMGELPQSDSTHLDVYPLSPQYPKMEIIVNTIGLSSYTWILPYE